MFGSYAGLYIFNPAQMKLSDYAPPVVISDLKINGLGVNPKEKGSPLEENITLTEKIKLKYNQNSFNIEFAMLNFFQPNNNQYAYYLDGFERDWNSATRYNVASYRNVPPGTYTFKVKGSNSLGVWTDKETELTIVVAPPFYKTAWAFIIYFALLLAAICFTIKIAMKIQSLNMAINVEKRLTEYKLRFFTNISHEFRTPLTIIRGTTDKLNESENLNETDRQQVNLLTKSSTRLLRLVEQLLEFRKLQNDRLELNVEKTEVVKFLNDIYLMFKEMADKKQIDFTFISNLPQHDMFFDHSVWDKITYNFLSNAIKHTPVGGKIEMKLEFSQPADTLTVSVSDNGAGVSEDKQPELFKRFAQFNSAVGGTGIGLHLTAELAALHKGKAGYEQSKFGGACFFVSIPLADENYFENKKIALDSVQISTSDVNEKSDYTTSIENETEVVVADYKDYKLLIIEDDDEVQDFLYNSLSGTFTVFAAKNGEEGLEIARREQPMMIVCDVMMPGISGFEVTRCLKNDFLTSHIPVILLTAYTSEQHKIEGIQSGADSYITKPFSVKYLTARIVKLIEQRKKLQQRFSQLSGVDNYSIIFTDKDKEFIEKVQHEILNNLTNTKFSVNTLAEKFKIGRTSFFKKMKGITGHSPNEYINIIRMKKAAELLATSDLNIAEISYQVGIEDPSYFTRYFKSQFGKTPLQYRRRE